MHSINYLANHSFELADTAWSVYTEKGTPKSGAASARRNTKRYLGQYAACFDQTKMPNAAAGVKQSLTLKAGTYTYSGYASLDKAASSKA